MARARVKGDTKAAIREERAARRARERARARTRELKSRRDSMVSAPKPQPVPRAASELGPYLRGLRDDVEQLRTRDELAARIMRNQSEEISRLLIENTRLRNKLRSYKAEG